MEHIGVSVYRDSSSNTDCTNNGVSSRHNRLELFWDCTRKEAENYCIEKGIKLDTAIFLVKRELWGEDHSFAEPLIRPQGKLGGMMGGNFVFTCDSRLYKLGGLRTALPIPLHDRFETQEDYNGLCV